MTVTREPTVSRWGEKIKRRVGNTVFIFLVPFQGKKMKVGGRGGSVPKQSD